jgi:glucuronate isomerase
MQPFINDNFLLQTDTARLLYHDFAKKMPIIDYHCHLPPDEIANNKQFSNMTEIWLKGDHYKWRAMRTLGVPEKYITGTGSDREKFQHWAQSMPHTMRNPLYHWAQMELKNPYDVTDLLNATNADSIYDACNEQMPKYTTQNLLRHFDVRVVCTTDDPCDDLAHHAKIHQNPFGVKILPAFRPDKAMEIETGKIFLEYVKKLESVANVAISDYDTFIIALKKRHDFFAEMGCQLSDHGLETMYATPYTERGIKTIFQKALDGKKLKIEEILQFKSAMLYEFAVWDCEKGWTQQFHLGAIRNNNARMLRELGKDVGVDSIGDFPMAVAMSHFFNRLENENKLTKTVIYNLNPADNEVFATMIGNFQGGGVRGKMQWGSGWWFLDQKDGMTKQINALSNMGVLSCFIGMLTDSRSFLSYSRHDYFRRLLCNIFAADIKNGELPNDTAWIGNMVQDICYTNAAKYFNW